MTIYICICEIFTEEAVVEKLRGYKGDKGSQGQKVFNFKN